MNLQANYHVPKYLYKSSLKLFYKVFQRGFWGIWTVQDKTCFGDADWQWVVAQVRSPSIMICHPTSLMGLNAKWPPEMDCPRKCLLNLFSRLIPNFWWFWSHCILFPGPWKYLTNSGLFPNFPVAWKPCIRTTLLTIISLQWFCLLVQHWCK